MNDIGEQVSERWYKERFPDEEERKAFLKWRDTFGDCACQEKDVKAYNRHYCHIGVEQSFKAGFELAKSLAKEETPWDIIKKEGFGFSRPYYTSTAYHPRLLENIEEKMKQATLKLQSEYGWEGSGVDMSINSISLQKITRRNGEQEFEIIISLVDEFGKEVMFKDGKTNADWLKKVKK